MPMKLDDRIVVRARKNHTEILNALAEIGQDEVAKLMGVSDSTVSRFKADLEFLSALLAALERKVVVETAKHVSESRWRSVCEMASIGIEAMRDEDSEFGRL